MIKVKNYAMISLLLKAHCLAVLIVFSGTHPTLAQSINSDAEAVGRAIPVGTFKPESLQKASGEMHRILGVLAKTNRNSRSSLQAVMGKGLDFRQDIGPAQKATTTNAILNAWEMAMASGALVDNRIFTALATKGRYSGQNLIFENVVPAEIAPEFSGYIGNVRLVAKDNVRKKGDPLTKMEEGFLVELKNVEREHLTRTAMLKKAESQVEKLAINKDEAEARYQSEVEEAGEMVKQAPNIQLTGQKLSSPSKMNGNRYRVLFEVNNLSRHPTQIEVEYKIVGYTENENLLYEMKRTTQVLKLRRSETNQFEFWTDDVSKFAEPLKKFDPKKSTKIYYRGYLAVARFDGKVIATIGSDGRLQRIASGEESEAIPKI